LQENCPYEQTCPRAQDRSRYPPHRRRPPTGTDLQTRPGGPDQKIEARGTCVAEHHRTGPPPRISRQYIPFTGIEGLDAVLHLDANVCEACRGRRLLADEALLQDSGQKTLPAIQLNLLSGGPEYGLHQNSSG
jgi:hypothetical protein